MNNYTRTSDKFIFIFYYACNPRSVNTIGQITERAESQKHGVYLHLMTKLGQSCHVVYHVQPIVMVYTPQNRVHNWDSA